MSQILIAEDESRIASFLEKGLRENGFGTIVAGDGELALLLARTGGFDLLILDLGLPRIHGTEVLRRLRAEGFTLPVIILSARDAVDDRVAGLEGGANDYVTKPFAFSELLARVRLRLRDGTPEPEPGQSATELQAAGLVLDLRTRRVSGEGVAADLTAREYTLMETFMRNPDQVLSRGQLLERVWGLDFDPNSNVVDVFVRALRTKIGAERIQTVRGMGYRLRVPT